MINKSSLTKEYYKTGELAKMLNLTTRTVQKYCQNGLIDDFMSETNRRYITKDSVIKYLLANNLLIEDNTRIDVIYARVSTHKQKNRGDLERQVDKIKAYAADKNPKNLSIHTDVASGLNDNRKELSKLLKMIMDNKVDRVFVLYKDRLTRFGFNYLKLLCSGHGTEIVIVSEDTSDKTIEEELAEDIISIIHSFSGKLYGMRRKVKNEVAKELGDERE